MSPETTRRSTAPSRPNVPVRHDTLDKHLPRPHMSLTEKRTPIRATAAPNRQHKALPPSQQNLPNLRVPSPHKALNRPPCSLSKRRNPQRNTTHTTCSNRLTRHPSHFARFARGPPNEQTLQAHRHTTAPKRKPQTHGRASPPQSEPAVSGAAANAWFVRTGAWASTGAG